MIRRRIKMLLHHLIPAHWHDQSAALRRASELHALSSLAVGSEARKTQLRVEDMKVTADAAERRARERGITLAIDDALEWPSLGGPGENGADKC